MGGPETPWKARVRGDDQTHGRKLAIDLKAAGIARETDCGVVHFHALRGTYIAHLVNSGASVKMCQTLARHSTPVLTIGVYAKTSLHDLTSAVEALPDLTPSEPASEREYMQATGTDGKHIRERFAHLLPTGEDGNGRDHSDTDGMTSLDHQSSMIVSSSKNEDLDGVVQDDSGSDGERRRLDSNRGWRFCRPLHNSPISNSAKRLRLSALPLADHLPNDICRTYPDLATVVNAWPDLPEALKAGILAMVKAAAGSKE